MMATSEKSTMEELKDTVTDKDHPMEKKEPGAPFVVVALTYLGVLAVSLLLIAFLIWLF